jgi:SAM-dependent methyltransferase
MACGAGDELRLLALTCQTGEVVGLERDRALVRSARQATRLLRSHVTVLEGDGTDLDHLGLQARSFDAVMCVDAAYHLRPRQAFLRQAFELLRPGGRLAYTDLCRDERAPAWASVLMTGAWTTRFWVALPAFQRHKAGAWRERPFTATGAAWR